MITGTPAAGSPAIHPSTPAFVGEGETGGVSGAGGTGAGSGVGVESGAGAATGSTTVIALPGTGMPTTINRY
jgi:hypothetical protein